MMKPKKIESNNSEKGIVLVIVIIIVSILTILVADLIYFTQIDREISTNTIDEVKARYIAKSGVHVAAGTLRNRSLENLDQIVSSVGSVGSSSSGFWSIRFPAFPVGDGSVAVTVTDERAKVNLNALVSTRTNRVDQQVLVQLRELFRFLDVDESKSERFIASLTNWLDRQLEGASNDQNSNGASSDFYRSLEKPYEIKNGLLDSVQEIRLIDGMDEEFFNKIKDYVTIYPKDKRINFSTATKAVIMAAVKASAVSSIEGQGNSDFDEVSDDDAEQIADEIIELRQDQSVIDQRKAREIATGVESTSSISAGLVGVVVNSGYSDTFSVNAVGSVGGANPTKRIIDAVLLKTNENNQSRVSILSWKEL